MIKLTQKTLNLFDLLIRHSFHYWIWTFCALFIIFDKILHMPLELLSHFNFIPEFIINLSKIINSKSIETTIPEITVMPANNDELIAAFREIISSLQQEISIMNSKIDNLIVLIQDNMVLLQKQLNFQKDLFIMVEKKLNSLNISKDLINISYKLDDMNAILQIHGNTQVEVGSRVISHIKETKTILSTLDNNILNINKSVLNIDLNKPLSTVNDTLNQIVINQKNLFSAYQSNQELNLQNFNSILEMQNLGFNAINDNVNEIFSKMHEIRNHNLGLYQQLTKSFDVKLLEQQTDIVSQITEEINRPKTSVTQATTKSSSWSNIFDKKN